MKTAKAKVIAENPSEFSLEDCILAESVLNQTADAMRQENRIETAKRYQRFADMLADYRESLDY